MAKGVDRKLEWKENFLLSFTYPEKIFHFHYSRRKYRITVKFLNKDKKEKYKTIYFGQVGIRNKIDGKSKISKKRIHDNIFHPYFWEKKLLETKPTIEEAFIMAVHELLPKDVIDLEKLQKGESF